MLPSKLPLPDLFIEEMQEYIRLSNKPTRTTTGQASFTNPRTLATYTTVGSLYDSQGESGLSLLLYNVNPNLKQYIFDNTAYAEIRNQSIQYEYQSPTVVAQEIRVSKLSSSNIVKFKLDSDVSGGNITISLDSGATSLPLYEIDGVTPITSLDAGFQEVVYATSFFILREKGSKNKVWLQQYDGTNPVLKDDKGKDVTVKIGDYIYNEFYPTFINDGLTGQVIPPTTAVHSETELKATVNGTLEMNVLTNGNIYEGFTSKENLWLPTMEPPFIYGIRIDQNNTNPETSVIYTDDAVGFTGGSSAWDSTPIFQNIKPCVLLNGVVNYYLNPNNFAQKADLSPSNITTGADGDVMIEIPKLAYMIYTEGQYVYVKVTDSPDAKSIDSRFVYFGHTRTTEGDKDNLYIGAYLGWYDGSSKLRSLSGKTPTATQTIGTFRTQAQANGAGYSQVGFYPLTLLQCLYAIRYKNLDSQTALGRGYVDGNASAIATGGTNAKGMYYGEGTGKQQMKFLGIEDFWGNLRWWIDGLFSNETWNILTAFTSFNDTGSGYTDRGQGATANLSGYMGKIQGSSQTGYIIKEVGTGSATTNYCDSAFLTSSCLPTFGGNWYAASTAGAFLLLVTTSAAISTSLVGSRLMFL